MKRAVPLLLLALSLATMFLAAGCAGNAQAEAIQAAGLDAMPDQVQPGEGKGRLGIFIATMSEQVAQRLGIQNREGVAVVRLVPDGPAAKAGVQEKDVITAADGTAVKDVKALQQVLKDVKEGDSVQLSVVRGDQNLTLTVTAGAAPERGRHRGQPGRPKHQGALPGLGGLLGDLKDVPAGERFDHILGGEFSILDKDKNKITIEIIPGKVTAASDTSLTITRNDGGQSQTFTITNNTKARPKVGELKAGDNVVVVTRNGSQEASAVISPQALRPHGPGPGPRGQRPAMPQEFRERIADAMRGMPLPPPFSAAGAGF